MEIPRGEITKTVYTLVRRCMNVKLNGNLHSAFLFQIKDEKFVEAVEILEQLLELQPMVFPNWYKTYA